MLVVLGFALLFVCFGNHREDGNPVCFVQGERVSVDLDIVPGLPIPSGDFLFPDGAEIELDGCHSFLL
jgi:hypothetical protein